MRPVEKVKRVALIGTKISQHTHDFPRVSPQSSPTISHTIRDNPLDHLLYMGLKQAGTVLVDALYCLYSIYNNEEFIGLEKYQESQLHIAQVCPVSGPRFKNWI
jgi:hypothetical protein